MCVVLQRGSIAQIIFVANIFLPYPLQIQDCANYFQVAQKQFNDILQSSSAMNTPKQIQKVCVDFPKRGWVY